MIKCVMRAVRSCWRCAVWNLHKSELIISCEGHIYYLEGPQVGDPCFRIKKYCFWIYYSYLKFLVCVSSEVFLFLCSELLLARGYLNCTKNLLEMILLHMKAVFSKCLFIMHLPVIIVTHFLYHIWLSVLVVLVLSLGTRKASWRVKKAGELVQ